MVASSSLVMTTLAFAATQVPVATPAIPISQQCRDALVQRAALADTRGLRFTASNGDNHSLVVSTPSNPSEFRIFHYLADGRPTRTELYVVGCTGKLLAAVSAYPQIKERDINHPEVQRDLHEELERFAAYGKAQGICS